MNVPVLLAGILAAATTVGHFVVGSPRYLRPVMDSDVDDVPRRIMQAVFHYVSVWLVLSSCVLLWQGVGQATGFCGNTLITFIAAHYAAFAFVQLITTALSGIPNAVFRLFQWIPFLLIALLSLLGVYL
jgi:hypothetical protein